MMQIQALLKTLLFIGSLLTLFLLFRFTLKRLVSQTTYPLWMAAFLFTVMSLQLFLSPETLFVTEDKLALAWIQALQYILWWISLYYLVNQLITVFIWTKVHSEHGIMVSKILKDITTLLLLVVTMAAILSFVFNKSVWGILTASSVVAIILGYSAQATLSDIFAGLGLNTGKEFKEGDWICVHEATREMIGKVVDLNWRVVKLQTKDNNYLTYPNSTISKLSIINFSAPSTERRINLPFQTRSTISPGHIKAILLSAAKECREVQTTPAPKVELAQVKNLEQHYQLTYYTDSMDESTINDAILSTVWYKLYKEPNKTVQMSFEDKPVALWNKDLPLQTIIPKRSVADFLKQCSLFQDLTIKDRELLATKIRYHAFGPPERILSQGEANSSLFIIYHGSVEVYVSNEDHISQQVATLSATDYFGEMSLLTGEACSASVFAKEECLILEIDHDNMGELFLQKPALIKHISRLVVERQKANLSLQLAQQQEPTNKEVPLIDRMVKSIKLFFHH